MSGGIENVSARALDSRSGTMQQRPGRPASGWAFTQQDKAPLPGSAALRTHLEPLRPWLDAQGITEISVNRAHEIWIARQGHPHMECHSAPGLSRQVLLG